MMQIGISSTLPELSSKVKVPISFYNRLSTNSELLDKLVGGSLMPGSSFTLCAPAGCGKTTLMLQMLDSIGKGGTGVLYVSGEEDVCQLSFNCKRLGVKNVKLCNETDVDVICGYICSGLYGIVIVDSFQCLRSKVGLNSRQLGIYCINRLVKSGKESNCVVGIIMHQTKEGKLKGDTFVPHVVDMTIYVETVSVNVRSIRTEKNRFGRCGSINLLMGSNGYDLSKSVVVGELSDYEELFLSWLRSLDGVMLSKVELEKIKCYSGISNRKLLSLMEGFVDRGIFTVVGTGNNRNWLWEK